MGESIIPETENRVAASSSSAVPLPSTAPAVPNQPSQRWHRFLSFPVAIACMLFLIIFIFAEPSVIEPDIWWHLQNAHHMASTYSLPRSDTYSFTATGSPWVDHEWLSELVFYGGYRAMGLRGIAIVYTTLAAITFAGLYYLSCFVGANPKTASIVMGLGILLGSVSFGPRMLLFGWVFMVMLVIILERYAVGRSGPLWLIPPLFCVWINFHGSWLFGMIVLGIFIASGLLQGEWGLISAERFSFAELKKLAAVAALSVAALFVNPMGYKLVAYPFDLMLRQQSNINNVEEWQSVDFHHPRGKIVMVLLLAIFAAALFSRRKWKLREAVLGAFALYVALMYWRMQFFAALVFVPLLATRIRLFPPYDVTKEKRFLNAAIIAIVIVVTVVRFPSEAKLQEKVRHNFPQAALAYMREHNIRDHVFNDYLWGGYMVLNAPAIKTFIDGRADLFVYSGVFDDYMKIIRLQKTTELLDHYRIHYMFLKQDTPMAYFIGHHPCWRQLYSDEVAVLYVRDETTSPTCKV